MNEQGDVQSYVTPAVGVQLRRYIGRTVAITGTTGIVPDLGKKHVIAKRVTLLQANRPN